MKENMESVLSVSRTPIKKDTIATKCTVNILRSIHKIIIYTNLLRYITNSLALIYVSTLDRPFT